MSRTVLLINANRMRPPIGPLALDYLGDRLRDEGYKVALVDLAWDSAGSLAANLDAIDPLLVGLSFRNTDDCFWPSGDWFVPSFGELVAEVRSRTKAPIVVGGCGYSIFPAEILVECGADFGITGDGEDVLASLAHRLARGRDPHDLPGLIRHDGDGRITVNPPLYRDVLDISPRRSLIDNPRYFREGGMGNIETKRGCPAPCIYCADPVARGRQVRCRPPASVAAEIENLLERGIDVLHLCDGEFNIPRDHALAVCEAIVARGLGRRVRWYGYAACAPFDAELASAMRRAGCIGVNFGADSGCDRMLRTLRRGYTREAVAQAVRCSRDAGLTVMLDLLLGGPGEDRDTVAETIAFCRRLDPDRIGAATGIRLYPGTALAQAVRLQGPFETNPNLRGVVTANDDLLRPIFYMSERLGDDPAALVCDCIDGDARFFPPPRVQDVTNYNYNDNAPLEKAIAAGHRGAYWDILRRLASTGAGPSA